MGWEIPGREWVALALSNNFPSLEAASLGRRDELGATGNSQRCSRTNFPSSEVGKLWPWRNFGQFKSGPCAHGPIPDGPGGPYQ
jgi:hypothetical protein